MRNIILYSTSQCPFCKMTRDFMKENNIEFTDHNVGEDQNMLDEMVKKSGQMGVPVIDIDGTIIVGFDKPKISQVLGITK